MTEKNYGGASNIPKGKMITSKENNAEFFNKQNNSKINTSINLTNEQLANYRKAGKIAQETVRYAKSFIKPGIKLLDIAEKIEHRIQELGGKPAFPCNLSINDIAAHYTPSFNDETKATGLLKIDLGVHVQGCIADTAFSLDLENSEENKKLILASEKAVEEAIKAASKRQVNLIGKAIHQAITSLGFSPVRNLSGHELSEYRVHAGITIPNYDNNNTASLEQGAYAIEPFATSGIGLVYDSSNSGIYRFSERKPVRDSLARKILDFIQEEYKTLPFCERWIIKKFGLRAKLSLSLLEKSGSISQYQQLVEKSHQPVSQAEHTILVSDKVEVTTK